MNNQQNIQKHPSDIWYDEMLDKVIDRYKMLLRPKTPPVCHIPKDAENIPAVKKFMETVMINLLGIRFPDIPEAGLLKDHVARDFGKWMKNERPDCFSGIIKELNLDVKMDSNEKADYEKLKTEGNYLFSQKKFKEAIEKYIMALQVKSLNENERGILHTNIANAFYELNEISSNPTYLKESKKNVKKAINFNQKYVKAYYRLGKIYEKRDKLDKALSNYEKCVVLSPGIKEIINSISSLKLKIFDRNRLSNLFSDSFPTDYEEHEDKLVKNLKIQMGPDFTKKDLYHMEETIKDIIPGQSDVFEGHKYRDGSKDIKQDYESAAKYYTKAYSLYKNPEAAYNLALLYSSGRGVKLDFAVSTEFLKFAAESEPFYKTSCINLKSPVVGVAEAQHSLALRYEEGIYLEKNSRKAVEMYEKAYQNGSPDSANNLGVFYTHGDIVPQNLKKAEELLLFSFSKNNSQSITNLVDLYIIMEKPKLALIWQNRAIERGCMFSALRDSKIKKEINLMNENFEKTGIPEWECKMNLDNSNLSFDERFDIFRKKNKNFNDQKEAKEEPKFILNSERIEIILTHRRAINYLNSNYAESFIPTTIPLFKNVSGNISSREKMTKIYFNEIDSTVDQIHNGKYLCVINIDIPLIPIISSHATFLRVEDENHNFHRVGIYNLGRDKDQIFSKFNFGVKLKIYNPYHRLAMDGKQMIRVDDPGSIEIIGYFKQSCRTCGKENCKMKCSQCLKAFYCSKECQLDDWKILEHKLICNLLK